MKKHSLQALAAFVVVASFASVMGCSKKSDEAADSGAVAVVEEAAAPVAVVEDTGAAPTTTAQAAAPSAPYDLPDESDQVTKSSSEIGPQNYKEQMDKLESQELGKPGY